MRILNEDKIFPIEIGIFQRKIWKNIRLPGVQLFEDRCPVVSGEKFLTVTLGSLRNLCTVYKVSKTDNVEFFHFLEALEDLK